MTIGNIELIPKHPTESFMRITKIRPDAVGQLVQKVAEVAQGTRDKIADIEGVWGVELSYDMDEARFEITSAPLRGVYCAVTYEQIYLDMIQVDNEDDRTQKTIDRIMGSIRERVAQ